jgi:hypothetical protein
LWEAAPGIASLVAARIVKMIPGKLEKSDMQPKEQALRMQNFFPVMLMK